MNSASEMTAAWPPLAELLPHGPEAIMLERVESFVGGESFAGR